MNKFTLIPFDSKEHEELYSRYNPYFLFYKDKDNENWAYGFIFGEGIPKMNKLSSPFPTILVEECEYDIHPVIANAMFKSLSQNDQRVIFRKLSENEEVNE